MKKLLYLALALVLILTLAACVKKDVTTAPDPSGTQAPSGTPEPTGDAPHTHAFGDWTVVTAATCTTDGTKERVCSCGEKETATVTALGHSYPTDETSVHVSDDGSTAEIDATCTACGHAGKGAYSGVLVRDGVAYRFVDGTRVTIDKEIIECGGVRYWVLGNAIQTGVYVPVDGYIYYFGEDGEMVCGGSNGEYDFNENGALTGSDIVLDIGGERYEVSGSTAAVHTHKYVDGKCSVCGAQNYSMGLKYTLNDDSESYCVSGLGTCEDSDVIIPSTYGGLPVTSIGKFAFYNCTYLTSITIPDSVTSIGAGAFHDCTGLTDITIPDSVTSISKWAFDNGPFDNCPIETATIPAIACAYIQNDKLATVVITSGESIGEYAFRGCSSLTSVTIPDSVTSIGEDAFAGCTGLTSITIPDSVTSIGNYAFYYCTSLTSVTIGNGVTSIGHSAFYNCTGLTDITIPDGVTSIGDFAFAGCTGLTGITFKGTKEQWNAMSKNSYWDIDTGNYMYTIYCTDGEISK